MAGATGAGRSDAAQAGAWETFYNQKNADAWAVFDFADGLYYKADWSNPVAGVETVSIDYVADNAVSFLADVTVGSGAMVGDYPAAKISGLMCDAYIGDLAALDYVDCSVLAIGPAGPTKKFYYSTAYYSDEFAAGGWWVLQFSFDDPWFYLDGSTWVSVNAHELTAIDEVDFTFYPVAESAGGSRVGIDNVTLEPTLATPTVTTAVTAAAPRQFEISFTPGPGVACRLEKMRLPPASGWDAVVGETAIIGPGMHVFHDPMATAKGIFRVAADLDYRMIITP